MSRRHPRVVATLVVASMCLGACSGAGGDDAADGSNARATGKVRVGVALYPLEEIVRRVGGEHVEIVHITPPGVNSHDVELSAKTLDQLAAADVVLYLGDGFQPRVETALDQLPGAVRTIDMLQIDGLSMPPGSEHSDGEHAHEGADPHVWLDPANMIVMTRLVESVLVNEIAGDVAVMQEIASNSNLYVAELSSLDDDVDAGLGVCDASMVVTSHEAFGHLFARLGLDHVSITGLDPAEQPSAQVLNDIAAVAREAGVTTVFVDATVSTRFAETIASEIGASVAVLDPVESLSAEAIDDGDTYVSLQQENLRVLADGLGCR